MTQDVTPITRDTRAPVSFADEIALDQAKAPAESSQPAKSQRSNEMSAPSTGRQAVRYLTPTPQPDKPKKHKDPRVHVGDTAGVDRRTADRFRRGQMSIDGRLDLHGMTRDAAQDALLGFVDRAVARDFRCVLIITGKGSMREDGGVLKREVPHWLNLPHIRRKIVAVTQAQQRHGGDGALYVLLRRRRGESGMRLSGSL